MLEETKPSISQDDKHMQEKLARRKESGAAKIMWRKPRKLNEKIMILEVS